MPKVPWLGARFPLRARVVCSLNKRRIGRGGTIGVARGLGHARFERGDLRGLLLDDSEQINDQLAHHEWDLFPTGAVNRNPCW
jgi:hypothetical protein